MLGGSTVSQAVSRSDYIIFCTMVSAQLVLECPVSENTGEKIKVNPQHNHKKQTYKKVKNKHFYKLMKTTTG